MKREAVSNLRLAYTGSVSLSLQFADVARHNASVISHFLDILSANNIFRILKYGV